MASVIFAVGEGNEVALLQQQRLSLYKWGNPRPVWRRTLSHTPLAVYPASRFVCTVTTDTLYQIPRVGSEPVQRYTLPAAVGTPRGVLATSRWVVVWGTRGALASAQWSSGEWQVAVLGRGALTAAAWVEGGVVVADEAGEAHWVRLGAVRAERRWKCGLGGVWDWQWHGRRGWLAGACADGLVKVWEFGAERLVGAWASHRWGARCLAWETEGAVLASWGEDGWLWFYDGVSGRALVERMVEAPREVRAGLALRWRSAEWVELLTVGGFWRCRVSDRQWREDKLS